MAGYGAHPPEPFQRQWQATLNWIEGARPVTHRLQLELFMETKSGLHLRVIVPALVLALSMNPFAYAQSQQPSPPQPADPQNAQTTHDASDIPPMPPEHSFDAASPAFDPLPDSPGAVSYTHLTLPTILRV